jgi:hypothetical protein
MKKMAKTPRPLPVDSSSWNAGRDSRDYKQLGADAPTLPTMAWED